MGNLDDDDSGMPLENQLATEAIFIMARAAAMRAIEQLFHGLNGIAPLPDGIIKALIAIAYDGWLDGVGDALKLGDQTAKALIEQEGN